MAQTVSGTVPTSPAGITTVAGWKAARFGTAAAGTVPDVNQAIPANPDAAAVSVTPGQSFSLSLPTNEPYWVAFYGAGSKVLLHFLFTDEAPRYTAPTIVAMHAFTEKEIEYLRGQRLGRMATVGRDGAPHVVPVGFRLGADAQTIEIGGHGLSRSKKWRDLQANPRIAFVADDLASTTPWTPRGIEVRGRAELNEEGGHERFGGGGWDKVWIRIEPERIVSWGIEGPAFSDAGRSARSVGKQ